MKAIRVATVALCALIMVLPSLAMPFFGSGDDLPADQRPVSFPSLSDGEGGLNSDFDREFEAWFNSRFAFRKQVVRAGARLSYGLLRTSPNADVIVGDEGWLYFAETAPDYTGEGGLTEAELDRITENLRMLAEALNARGARLYVAIVPNKSTIYPQYMPGRYAPRTDGGNIARLESACAELPLEWIDLVGPLRAAAAGETLVYLKTDTHWNPFGAATASDAILKAMGRGGLGDWRVDGEVDFSEGDLARLMGLPGGLEERAPVVSLATALPEADYERHVLRVEGEGDGRLLMFRDSFAISAGAYLAQAFEQTELRWESPLDAGHECDAALLMIAERNLREYLLDMPLLDEDDDESEFDEDLPADEDFVPFSFDDLELDGAEEWDEDEDEDEDWDEDMEDDVDVSGEGEAEDGI